jgi:hypothetical protein
VWTLLHHRAFGYLQDSIGSLFYKRDCGLDTLFLFPEPPLVQLLCLQLQHGMRWIYLAALLQSQHVFN